MALIPIWFVSTGGPAAASCAVPPTESPYRFTGVVTDTDDGGRVATVRTDAGRTVTVTGAEGGPGTVTSVDRAFDEGVRYEFHPVNDASPYRDNACTATRAIGSGGLSDGEPSGAASGWVGIGAGMFALVSIVSAAVVLRRQTRIRLVQRLRLLGKAGA